MAEWPQERMHRLSNPAVSHQRLADMPAPLIQEVVATEAFTTLVQAVLNAFNEGANPQTEVAKLSTNVDRPDAFGAYDETVRQAVLGLAAVAALRAKPTSEMWEYLWSLAWHSAPLATFLPQAVVAAAEGAAFREQFLTLAPDVINAAIKDPGRRAIQRDKEVGANLREHWQSHPQLSALWRGNFQRSLHAVDRDDDHILSIVADIDVAAFVGLLALYDYPDPVAHALTRCGAGWRFERWRAVMAVAPAAFDERARWNGSLILPILLSIALNQFQFGAGRDPTASQLSAMTDDIKSLAAEVVKTIAPRADYVGCMTRWSNWLVRTGTTAASSPANTVPVPTDARSHGFIEAALVDALIDEAPEDHWTPGPAEDAEDWEPWCQLAAGALVALGGKAPMPSMSAFFEEWRLTADGWPTLRGKLLRLHAGPFDNAGVRADGYGARLLAMPVVEAEAADVAWKRFWDSTATLREVVEFGDADEPDDGGWHGRMNAARLLMFQFSVGLMMLDHLILPQRQPAYDSRSAVERLLPSLDAAVREMAAIDQLNGKFWTEAVRHLAIRRATWLSGGLAPNGIVLSTETKPTLADFIRELAGDTENLLALAFVAQQNGIDAATLSSAFKEAGIDLEAEISVAERLRAISPRAIGLTEEQIGMIRAIP